MTPSYGYGTTSPPTSSTPGTQEMGFRMVAPAHDSGGHKILKSVQSTKAQWDLKDLESFSQWHLELIGLVRRQASRYFLASKRPPDLPDEPEDLPQTRKGAETLKEQNLMHASNRAAMQQQWDEWNEITYDILIASVKLSPSQNTYVANHFATASDGEGFYRYILSFADNHKDSAQLRLKTKLRDLKITADMTSDDVAGIFELIEEIWPQIHEHQLSTDWSSAAVSKALSLFPMDHPDAAVIAAHRVQHSRSKSNKDSWPDFTSFKNELVEYLAMEEETRRANSSLSPYNNTALALNGRQPAKGSCTTCDLDCCKGAPCLVFNSTKPVSSPNLRAIINYFQEYAKENGYKTSMKGDKPSDEWIAKYKTKRAAQRQNDAAEAATNGPSSNPVVQQPEEDFWASLNGGASCVTIEGTDAIGTSPSIQQLADQLKANMEPTIVPTTMEPPATPKQKVPFETQPEEPETVSLPSKLAQRFESVSPPPAPKFEISAATPPFVTQHFGASATPPPSVLLQSVPLQSTASVTSEFLRQQLPLKPSMTPEMESVANELKMERAARLEAAGCAGQQQRTPASPRGVTAHPGSAT